MPTRKSGARGPARSKSPGKAKSSRQSDTALGSTVSGPSRPGHPDTELAEHAVEQAAGESEEVEEAVGQTRGAAEHPA